MPIQPVTAHLNLVSQSVMNILSYLLVIALIGWTIRLWRQEKSPFYLLLVLASVVAAFGEPLYDEAFSLYFYTNGNGHGITGFFTAFNVPQPIWAFSGYGLLYGFPAVCMTRKIQQGKLTAQAVWAWAGVEFAMSCAFEIIGINIGTYTYWGPHALRIDHYPVVIAVLEASQVMLFAIAGAHLRNHSKTHWSYFGLFALFPVTFFGANFGAGIPVILGIHTQGATHAVITVLTIASIALAGCLIRFVSVMIPVGLPAAQAPVAVTLPSRPERQKAGAASV